MSWATAPYSPTPPEIVRRMLKIARVGPGDVVYDLGCGDGRILIMVVKEFGADRAVGYEIREDLCRAALAEIERQGLQSRVKLVNGDLSDADLYEATVITLYLDESALNYNEIVLGCHYINQQGQMFPIALRADLPAYIVRGNLNLSEETIEAVGFCKRAEKLGVMDRLKNLNILPHGGGYTFPDMLEASGEVETGNKRYFITEMKSGIGQKIISSTEVIPFMYRGREVIVRTMELRMCDIVARLMPIYVLKI